MKRVFSSADQTIHVWAQQTQSEGRSANVFFEGVTLYSYGFHYPLGSFITNKKGEKAAVINAAGYSSTTAKHISWARFAVNHYQRFIVGNTEVMKALVRGQRLNDKKQIIEALSAGIEHRIACYNSSLRSDKIKRKAATLEKWKSEALADCAKYTAILDFYGYPLTRKASNALKNLTGLNPQEAKELAQKEAAREQKKREKAERERAKENAALIARAIPAWLSGADHLETARGLVSCSNLLNMREEIFLRLKGEEIETSRGARFPVSHGVKAFAFIQTVMAGQQGWQKNGKTIHLGHYELDSIEPNGDVKAGCHKIKYAQIEALAKQLKLIA